MASARRAYQKPSGARRVTDAPHVEWTRPSQLSADGLHVWRIALSAPPSPAAGAALAAEEVARARHLVDPAARARFLALRQATRAILARYVGAAPAALRFGREARGKPRILEPATDWHFNLSDSRDLALLAVSRSGPVGIDVEYVRVVSRRDGIARRMFGEAVAAALADSPPHERDSLFFRHWTAFEARQKATGAGLAGPRADPADWRVSHFVPAPGWLAAIAHATGLAPRIEFFRFTG
jgi:4'-phosphopantetheinyl transferase